MFVRNASSATVTLDVNALEALRSKACIASLPCSMPSYMLRADALNREAEQAHGADDGTVKGAKVVLWNHKDPAFAACTSIVSAARADHRRLTSAWQSDGYRLLPTAMMAAHEDMQRTRTNELAEALERLQFVMPVLLDQGRQRANGLAPLVSWPSPDEVISTFRISAVRLPVPEVAPLSAGILAEHAAAIRASQAEAVQAAVAQSQADMLARAAIACRALAGACSRYNPDQPGTRFHASLVDAVHEQADLLDAFNIVNDPAIRALAHEVRSSIPRNGEVLKSSPIMRNAAAQAMDAAAARLNGRIAALDAAGF